MVDTNTDESLVILVESLKSAPAPYISMPIINYLSTRTNQEMFEVLLGVVDGNQSHELHIRLLAAESLLNISREASRDQLDPRFESLIAETKKDGWPSELIERAEALRAPQN